MSGAKGALMEIGLGAAFNAFSVARTARANADWTSSARTDGTNLRRSCSPRKSSTTSCSRRFRPLDDDPVVIQRPLDDDPVVQARRRAEERRGTRDAKRAARKAERQ